MFLPIQQLCDSHCKKHILRKKNSLIPGWWNPWWNNSQGAWVSQPRDPNQAGRGKEAGDGEVETPGAETDRVEPGPRQEAYQDPATYWG